MSLALFDKFAEMVEALPAKAVNDAVQLERQMLEDDLAHKRTLPLETVRSIMAFADFLQNAGDAARAPHVSLPIQHLSFYRDTVKRMVQGGALPYEAGAVFDKAFSAAALKSLQVA